MYLKCYLFLKVGILNNLKYLFNRGRGRNFSGEMERKGSRKTLPGSLTAGEDCRRARGVAGGGGGGGWSASSSSQNEDDIGRLVHCSSETGGE